MNVLIRIAYDNNSTIRDAIDSVPHNNGNLYNLQPIINNKFDISKWDSLNADTKFFKLTQKKEAFEKDENGDITYFGYLKNFYKSI